MTSVSRPRPAADESSAAAHGAAVGTALVPEEVKTNANYFRDYVSNV